jgi:hypothetical protein
MNSPQFEKIFGVINYDSDEIVDKFISNLTKEQAYYCLMEAAKCGVRRGAFSLVENELISKSLRIINIPSRNNGDENLENPNKSSNLED